MPPPKLSFVSRYRTPPTGNCSSTDTCTEDCQDNGQIFAYKLGADGSLNKMGQIDAGGTSTCYLTIDKSQRNMLAVNYWDSTLAVIPLDEHTGNFAGPIHSLYDPNKGRGMTALAKKLGGVNHSCNDSNTIQARQADPHSHAIVLDPYVGTVAYVPDLGKDLIREFYYDREGGCIQTELNMMPSGLCTGHPDGPRYVVFHPCFNVAYVVNELSSTVSPCVVLFFQMAHDNFLITFVLLRLSLDRCLFGQP
jgi:6-phosphogluconolactonase